jgi:hypothetical protein
MSCGMAPARPMAVAAGPSRSGHLQHTGERGRRELLQHVAQRQLRLVEQRAGALRLPPIPDKISFLSLTNGPTCDDEILGLGLGSWRRSLSPEIWKSACKIVVRGRCTF